MQQRHRMSAGTQSIEKALALWRDVAGTGNNGARLTDLAAQRGLNVATVRRTLLSLVRSGWLEQDSPSRRYSLGARSVTLSAVSSRFSRLQHLAQSSLLRLAAASDDAVFLCLPLISDWVCIQRLDGSHPIRTHWPQATDRQPLGIGAAGLAFLAFAPHAHSTSARLDPAALTLTRAQGFAFNPGAVFADSWEIAACVCNEQGSPVAALGISAIASRLQADRRLQLASALKDEARTLSCLVAQDAVRQRHWARLMKSARSSQATASRSS
jgi:DNA-binding IclR family transcriptional regulator